MRKAMWWPQRTIRCPWPSGRTHRAETLSGTTPVTAAAGVATFANLSINNAGTGYTLTASATGLTGATSSAFNVTAGAAAKLVFTQQPTNVVAGSSITPSVKVSIEDALGNLVTTATNSVSVAIGSNPSSGTLSGTTPVAAVAGVATFSNLSINNTGTGYTLTANATGLTGATSIAFNVIVSIGPPAKLAFTVEPSNVVAGNSINPSVQVSVEDAAGNVVTTANNSVSMAIGINPLGGTLSGTTPVTAVNGVATFSNLSINVAAAGYSLQASATGLTSASSTTFNVTAGTANKLVFTQQPTTVVAGSSITPSVTVSIEDAQGNVVTTANNSGERGHRDEPIERNAERDIARNCGRWRGDVREPEYQQCGDRIHADGQRDRDLTGATSGAFNVTAGLATKLIFTQQPSNVAAGSSITPAVTVSVEDSLGNVVTTATNSVNIGIGTNAGSGTLSGTTPVTAAAGVATFSNLSINNVGTGYTLTASATGLTGATSSAFNVTASCTTNCTLSGKVTGPWVVGLNIAITGPSPATTITNATTAADGSYSFSGLTAGQYSVTASPGYTYSPATPLILNIGSNTIQNFTATSALTAYSISGKIFYSGSQHGNTIIRVFPGGCTNCNVLAGTSFSSAPSASGTSYTIRGLQPTNSGGFPSSYVVYVQIDTLGTGITNESNPEGSSTTFTVPSSDVTGVDITVSDRTPPSAPSTPNQNKFSVAPGNSMAIVQYKADTDSNNEEIATSYKVYYGTDTNASNGTGSPVTFKAQGDGTGIFILKNITNGLTYFKLTAVNVDGESAPTTPVSATLGPASGANSVSGTVTFSGTPTGPLYVGLYGNNGIFTTVITSPTSPQNYTLLGVPAGTYQNFAIIDMNNDGEVDTGDLDNVTNHSNPPTVTVSGTTTGADVTLGNAAAIISVPTSVQESSGQPNSYNISVQVDSGTKLPVSMTLFSGPNVAVPYDMNADQHSGSYTPVFNNSISPTVGDTYQFLVTYSDGTSSVLSAQVTAVLTSSFARNLVMQTTSPGSPTIPLLTWSAPSPIPSALPYSYEVGLNNVNPTSQESWFYSGGNNNNGNGIPSSQTSVLYNTDSSASPNSPLIVGGTYNWSVTVQDSNNNSVQYTTTYTVP